MTQEDLDEFVGALEGGKYPQGQHRLRAKADAWERAGPIGEWRYCCLGVLSHLQKDKVGLVEDSQINTTYYRLPGDTVQYGTNSDLHKVLQRRFNCNEAGFSVPLSELTFKEISLVYKEGTSGAVSAMGLNDGGIPFQRIAELARKSIVVINNYEERIPVVA